MSVEEVLRSTIAMLGTCHVLGSESERFSAALQNLKTLVNVYERSKEGEQHENHDKQGEDV